MRTNNYTMAHNKQRNMLLVGGKQNPQIMSLSEYMLQLEGGLSDHPQDKGGLTRYGITLPFYHDVLLHYNPRLNSAEITHKFNQLTPLSARGIYSMFFRKLVTNSPALYDAPTGLLAHYLDVAVNSGHARANKLLQRILHLQEDGIFGTITSQALDAATVDNEEAKLLMIRYARARFNFYNDICKNDPSQTCFLKGWTNRIERVNKYVGIFINNCLSEGL